MFYVLCVVAIVALALYLLNAHIPGTWPWLATAKRIACAVVTVLTLVWLLVVFGFAASDGPLFPRHTSEGPTLREHIAREH